MPVSDDVGPAAGDVYESLCAQVQLEYELWLSQGWRRHDPDRPYPRQAQLDAARAGAPIDMCATWLPALHRPESADTFDRVAVSPDGSMRSAGRDAAVWLVEQGL